MRCVPTRLALVASIVLSAAVPLAAQQGVQIADIDRSVAACQDFDTFANGAWRTAHPMPATQTTWARRSVTQDETLDKLRLVLEAASSRAAPRGSVDQLVGDFYAGCLDEKAINAAGISPAAPVLNAIAAIPNAGGVQAQIIELSKYGLAVPIRVTAQQDVHAPLDVIADVDVTGLGLPDRDYYLRSEPRFSDIRTKYEAHVRTTFVLAGYRDADATAAAAAVMRLETRLAEASLSRVELRDPKATDHPMPFAELLSTAPGFDWRAAFKAWGIPEGKLNLDQPALTRVFAAALKDTAVADWKHYLTWHLLNAEAAALPSAITDQRFAFFGTTMTGATEQRPRWQRCVQQTDALLGEALGQKYVEAYFSPQAKAKAREMATNIVRQLALSIEHNDWMSPATKARALEKVTALDIKVGYPDKWKDYSSVAVTRTNFFSSVLAAQAFRVRDDLQRIGRPLDRDRWEMTPPTLNAYYNPQKNEVVVPAGYLQPPGFNPAAIDAVNYGAIGVTIGHEISHSVDDQGAQFDAHGALTMWWTPEDFRKFEAKTACTTQQYDDYFVEPGVHHNGKLVTGEALGDLGGVNLAFRAYEASRAGKGPEPTIDGFTPEQQFFLAEAQWRGSVVRPEAARRQVQIDPHPLGKWRVIGPLSNMPEFADAWSCKPTDAMVRADRCRVW